jgi:fructose-1,6-bisphosphatase/inositol monophosphatase family enzyme
MQLPTSASGRSARDVARECAGVATDIIREGYGRSSVAAVKGRGNVVTETDFAAESAVMAMLKAEFPQHAILSEESAGTTRSDGWMWVVDPLDGTKNFSRAIPHFGFNLALCFENKPVIAVTTHPMVGEEYVAVIGEGCSLNGSPVTVSESPSLAESVVAIDMGYDASRGGYQLALATHLWPGMQSLRVTGSAALGFAFVASAKWDIYVHSDLQPWDIAAGLLLVREAGGVVRDRTGAEATIYSREAVAAPPAVWEDFARRSQGLRWAD